MTTPFPFTSGQVLTAAQMNAITTLPINDQTASYTLVVGDVGKRVIMNVASANTVTVNNSIFAAGDTIFIANKGAGVSTITAGAGVTINSASGLDLVTSQSGQLVALSASSFLFLASDVTATSGVVQVQSTFLGTAFTTTSTSFVDVTGLSVSITPTSASNKVLVLCGAALSAGAGRGYLQLVRNSTDIAKSSGFADTNQTSCASGSDFISQYVGIAFLDNPATTSATTYKFQIKADSGTTTHINSQAGATSQGNVSTITVMEVLP